MATLAGILITSAGLACGCGRTDEEAVLPWVKYRSVTGPGGSGMWAGSSHTEVLVRRWWGWSKLFDGNAAPGRPVVLSPTAVLVPSHTGSRIVHKSASEMPLACGDREAIVTVPPGGGFVDCVNHLAGPAPAIATSLRVRRLDPAGKVVASQEFTLSEPGRVFLSPSILFYDEAGTPYLVTFRDPWAETGPDGSLRSGLATPERLQNIACEMTAVGANVPEPFVAPAGHKVADCSSPNVWGPVAGRTLRDPWKP